MMNRTIRITVLALLACAMAAPSHAGPVIDWDPAYFYSTTPGVTPTSAPVGSNLFIVGTVSVFGPPLQFLNANDPTKDYTFYIYGMTSSGTTATPVPPLGTAYVTNYGAGTIELYEGTPRDAAFDPNPPNANVPSTFTNGTLLLKGTMTNFYTQTNNFSNFSTGNAEGSITWTGGTLLPIVSPGGQPCPSLITGGLSWHPGVLIPGYLFRHDGKIDLECPTPARTGTWGKIKALYR
jgi:hypothetical protein